MKQKFSLCPEIVNTNGRVFVCFSVIYEAVKLYMCEFIDQKVVGI
jgi:hypothetical protein